MLNNKYLYVMVGILFLFLSTNLVYAQIGIYVSNPHPVVTAVIPNPTTIVNGTAKNITVVIYNQNNNTGSVAIDGNCGDASISSSSNYNQYSISGGQSLQINMVITPSYNLSAFGGTLTCSLKARPLYNYDNFNSTPYTWSVTFNPAMTPIHIANVTGCASYGSWWGNGTAVGAKPYNLTILNYTGRGNNYSTTPGIPSQTTVIVPYGNSAFISASLKTIQTDYRLANQRITFCISDSHTVRTLGAAYTNSDGVATLNYDTTLMDLNQSYWIFATYGRNFSNQGDQSGSQGIYLQKSSPAPTNQQPISQQSQGSGSGYLLIVIAIIIMIVVIFFVIKMKKNKPKSDNKNISQNNTFCKKCGTKNSDAKFCKKCGNKL